MGDESFSSPGEAVVAGVLWHLSRQPWIQEMVEANDLEHFVEGCRSPQFDQAVGAALLAVRDAATGDAS